MFCLIKFSNIVKCYSTYSISDILKKKPNGNISIKGWIKSLRHMKDKTFIDIKDGSCNDKLQIVIEKSLNVKLNTGASVEVHGILIENTHKQQYEIAAKQIDIVGDCNVTDGYPFIPKQNYHPDYLRQYLHFRPRIDQFASMLRVRHSATLAIHEYFNNENFLLINTPIITSNDCEGAGEVFRLQPDSQNLLKSMSKHSTQSTDEIFFNKKVFLSVSGQMHLEAAAHALSRVYTLGPTFRAENSKSRLHLSEFYMLEAEIAFLNSLEWLLHHVEKLLKNITLRILSRHSSDVFAVIDDRQKPFLWLEKDFPILEYSDAVALLNNNRDKLKKPFNPDVGLTKEHELFLVDYNNQIPTFIINWPKHLKPFYMKSFSEDKVAAFDLLVPNVGELVGGSLREDNYDILKKNLPSEHDINLDWYLDLRKFGGVPTGGYGMGFERYLQFLLDIANIKDTIPFPRWPHSCSM